MIATNGDQTNSSRGSDRKTVETTTVNPRLPTITANNRLPHMLRLPTLNNATTIKNATTGSTMLAPCDRYCTNPKTIFRITLNGWLTKYNGMLVGISVVHQIVSPGNLLVFVNALYPNKPNHGPPCWSKFRHHHGPITKPSAITNRRTAAHRAVCVISKYTAITTATHNNK